MLPLAFLTITLQAFLNLAGALSPELSFDALYYHLTLPKLYLAWKAMPVIKGGLLYPSGFPQLMETLYAAALYLQGQQLAKLIHFGFGLAATLLLYQLIKKELGSRLAGLGAMIFYLSPTVSWLSTTAYIDLGRTFFELLAFYFLLKWQSEKSSRPLIFAGLAMGLSLSTKLQAWGSLVIFWALLLFCQPQPFKKAARNILIFTIAALSLSWPWYWRTWRATGNPFYPLFTPYTAGQWRQFSFSKLGPLAAPWQFTFHPDSLLTPAYLILLPLALLALKKSSKTTKLAGLYAFLGLAVWSFTPPPSIRYLLPYLPPLVLVSVNGLNYRWRYQKPINRFLIAALFAAAFINLSIRAIAGAKFIPYLTGKETKAEFLTKHLNFRFGDFYDTDGWLAKNIKENDLVLLYGVHNLYYVDFPFVHQSWAEPNMKFTYVLTQNMPLPARFGPLPLVHENKTTGVKVYALPTPGAAKHP